MILQAAWCGQKKKKNNNKNVEGGRIRESKESGVTAEARLEWYDLRPTGPTVGGFEDKKSARESSGPPEDEKSKESNSTLESSNKKATL